MRGTNFAPYPNRESAWRDLAAWGRGLLDLARETARDVQTWLPGVRVVAAALRETDCVKEVFVC